MENNGIDVNSIVTGIAGEAGDTLVGTVVGVLPVIVPVFAVFWGIRYALGKLRLNRAK